MTKSATGTKLCRIIIITINKIKKKNETKKPHQNLELENRRDEKEN